MLRTVRLISVIVAAAWASCAPAAAQTSPIVQHYRAYQAALEANDLATADREAAAALAASEARDGDGGRTAILAINLAAVRLLNNDAAGALEPGRRALTLAQSRGEAAGVSPAFAQLIVARAELAANEAGANEQLMQALDAAAGAEIDPAEVYDGARQLAAWSLRNERYEESARAWSIAASYAEGSRLPAAHARGVALTGSAASLMLGDVGDRRRSMDDGVAREASNMLHQALTSIASTPGLTTEGEPSLALRSYAEALAWRTILRAKVRTDGGQLPEAQEAQGDGADGMNEVGAIERMEQPRCLISLETRDGVRLYPSEAVRRARLGGVAALFRFNAAGELVEIESLSSVGGDDFGNSVENLRAWRASIREDSPANCRREMSVIRSIAFQIGN